MHTTEVLDPPPPPLRRTPPALRPLPAIPGGALPVLRAAPPHDLLVLTQRPDLTPEFFPRLVRIMDAPNHYPAR